MSAALYALFKAATKYDPDRGVKFTTYSWRVMEIQIYRLLKKSQKEWISLDAPLPDHKKEDLNLHDVLESEDPILQLENKLFCDYLLSFCTDQEKFYLVQHYMNKEKQIELADQAGWCYQNVQRIINQGKDRIQKSIPIETDQDAI